MIESQKKNIEKKWISLWTLDMKEDSFCKGKLVTILKILKSNNAQSVESVINEFFF